jgi:dihydroorotate dehydrogenase
LTEEENNKIRDNAKRVRMTVTQYMLSLVENKPLYVIDDFTKFIVQLKKIGNNLNQYTAIINSQKYVDYPARRAINDTQKELNKIAEMLNRVIININCPSKRTLVENEKFLLEELESINKKSAKLIERIKVDGCGDIKND